MISHLLVTGGAGFIGSHFVRHALRAGADLRVTVLDALTYAGDRTRLADVDKDPRLRFVHGDVCDDKLVARVVAGTARDPAVDAIAHFAAETHVDRSIGNPEPFVRTNVRGTLTILESMRAQGARAPRLLHVSTDEVYGDLGPHDPPFTEQSPLVPSSPYSASKTAADALVLAWVRTYGLHAVIARGANNYGTHQYPEKLIPVAIRAALNGTAIPLYGDGNHRREWLHVEDNTQALWTLLTAPRPKHAVYNVPGESDVTNRAIAELILDSLGLPRTSITHITDRPGHDRRYAIDGARLVEEFGWTRKRTIASAIGDLIAFERARLRRDE